MPDYSKAMTFISEYVPYVKKEMRRRFIQSAQLTGIITAAEADHITAQYRASGML